MLLPATPAARFACLIAGLCRAVAARAAKNPLAAPLLVLLWPRLNRLARRFASLAARVEAGTAAPRRRASPRPTAARSRPPYRRLPRRFAWLPRLVPEAAASGSQLQHLLAAPDCAALLAAPQAGRLLRPLCRMLGVRPPPGLAPAPRPARPRAATARPSAGQPPPAVPPPDRDRSPQRPADHVPRVGSRRLPAAPPSPRDSRSVRLRPRT